MPATSISIEGTSLTLDLDPYDGHVAVSYFTNDDDTEAALVIHCGQDVEAGIAQVLHQVEILIRNNLAIAPWKEL